MIMNDHLALKFFIIDKLTVIGTRDSFSFTTCLPLSAIASPVDDAASNKYYKLNLRETLEASGNSVASTLDDTFSFVSFFIFFNFSLLS